MDEATGADVGQVEATATADVGAGAGSGEGTSVAAGVLSSAQVEALRASLVQANPHVVPELIQGTTLEEVLASAEVAKSVYARVANQAAEALTAGIVRGGGSREPDLSVYEGLSGEGKIQLALRRRG